MLNNYSLKSTVGFVVMTVLVIGCTSSSNRLDGHWILKSAERNGQPTGTLTDLFMDFEQEMALVRTNLFRSEQSYEYREEKDKLSLTVDGGVLEFEILEKNSDRLMLSGEIRKTNFLFEFVPLPVP